LPFFAPIACVLVLGVSVTNRLRRSVELAVGVSVGVAVGDLIVVVIGPGWWQISVVVGLALLAALLFDVGALLLNQAAVSAVLIATLQPPGTTAAFSRWFDTLIGAAIGLLTAATLPSHPLTRARRGLAALLFDVGALLLNQAAVSAVLIATLQPPGTTAAFSRWIDTLIGAAIGLLTAATLPSHPLTRARRGLDALLDELGAVLAGVADALEAGDADAATAVLERARATQGRVDALADAVDAGFEITTIAPLRRRHRGELARLRAAVRPVDLALRNARVLARRAHASLRDGERPDADLVAVLRRLADAVGVLRHELTTGESMDGARVALLDTAALVPAQSGGYSAEVVLAQLRSMLVDLLVAIGMDRDEAVTAAGRSRSDPEG
ncbi:MAG TPA: FUSC family protein, partial [Actinomycetospora sp.]|nr:FUSC family protein [Actinomycetospora sp.]